MAKCEAMNRVSLLLVLNIAVGTTLAFATDVKPIDPHVRYVGRFDFQDPAGPRCAWPASTVEIDFQGTDLKATIRDGGSDRFEIVIDKTTFQVLKLQKGDVTYDIAKGLPEGNHVVQLVKRTETFPGTSQFLGFDVTGVLLTPKKPKHTLEVIGDSISCGYGNEGKTKEEHFSIETENAYLTYGAMAARDLDADFIDIAWSGRKMWPDFSIPDVYDYALPPDKNTPWDLKQQVPDAIVINLATNDFGKGIPDEKGWTKAYCDFIDRLRQRAPSATIYCAMGPMMNDGWPPKVKALSTLRTFLHEIVDMRTAAGDKNVKMIEFDVQKEEDGIGSDWHPSVTTHQKMANRLSQAIRADLGW